MRDTKLSPKYISINSWKHCQIYYTKLVQTQPNLITENVNIHSLQGFGNYIMALGVIETVALFVMVFIKKTLV